jgi:hypothetical protein
LPAIVVAAGEVEGRGQGRAGRDAHRDALLARHRRDHGEAVSLVTWKISSITPRSRIEGTKPAPMPWILCGRAAADSTGRARLDGDHRTDGLRAFSTWPTPVMVPPGADAGDHRVDRPSVSFQISSAVETRWISGLATLSNCCGITAPGVASTISLARATAPAMPFSRGVSSRLGAQDQQHLAPLQRHALGHDQDQLVALGGGHEGQRDAGVAAGRLDDHAAGLQAPLASRYSIIATPMRSFTEAERVEELQLGDHLALGLQRGGQARQAHQRRVADQVEDGVEDLAPAGAR